MISSFRRVPCIQLTIDRELAKMQIFPGTEFWTHLHEVAVQSLHLDLQFFQWF